MKGINKLASVLIVGLMVVASLELQAGNEQRVGQAGATQTSLQLLD